MGDQAICLRLLGHPTIENRRTGRAIKLGRKKAIALLAILTTRTISRQEVCTLLWEGASEQAARASLRQVLHDIRTTFGSPPVVISDEDMLRLDTSILETDVEAFCRLAGRPEVSSLEKAVCLYQGRFLEGLDLHEESFDDWIAMERRHLEARALSVLGQLTVHYGKTSRFLDAIDIAQRALKIDPLQEDIHRRLIEFYVAQGNLDAARRQAKHCRDLLKRELGVDPDPETLTALSTEPPTLPVTERARQLHQEIHRITASDGTVIACSLVGRGQHLVKTPNWMTHLAFEEHSPVWRHYIEEFSENHTFLRYDQRGNGLSDWDTKDISFASFQEDIDAVLDAFVDGPVPILGISQGAPIAVDLAARRPELVSGLILLGGFVRGMARRGEDSQEASRAVDDLIRFGWGRDNPSLRMLYTSSLIPGGTRRQMDWYNEMMRIGTSPQNAVNIRHAMSEIDVSNVLERVSAPTLVCHARGDQVVPYSEGEWLAREIPNARFVPLDSENHLLLEEEPAWAVFTAEVRNFLGSLNDRV